MILLATSVALTCFLFVLSGFSKIKNFDSTVNALKSVFWIKGIPNAFFQLAIVGAIVTLIGCPALMMYSVFNPSLRYIGKLCCYMLILFTVLASLLFHFPTIPSERINFVKNMSIIGGFLALSELF